MALIPKYSQEKFESCLNTFREIFSEPAVDGFEGSVLLPLDFSLEMDGISGIIPNSAFEIPTNCLPETYLTKKGESRIAFILHSIDQNFNDNKWTTKITGQTLVIRYDELTEEQKVKVKTIQDNLKKKAQKVASTPPNTPVSTGKGGSTRNIKGAAYKNGEIPPGKLRTILNEAKYNFPIVNKSDGGRVRLFTDASLALDQLLAAATKANIKLRINSAYRTVEDQKRVYGDNCPRGKCSPPTAFPGRSNHGFGLAVDLANNGGAKLATSMPEYTWVAENGPGFGFKRIASESWHWEYQTT
jgi:LAS superfamily LD-carboxypeptidase LdcB